jgi:predicted cytidylate kinase
MGEHQSITISGDLGSGKSTVAAELAGRLGLRKVSMGDMHRAMAQSCGLTELQVNRNPERSAEVDVRVDAYQRDLARSGETLVVDSRLGWHFFPDAFKVQLLTDPLVAARRVLGRPASTTEAYASLDETLLGLRERSDMERARFIRTYGADKARLENYDLVCDTTSARPGEVADVIIAVYEAGPAGDAPALFLDPARIGLSAETGGAEDLADVRVACTAGRFVLIAGRAGLTEALRRGDPLVRASLFAGPPPDPA